MERGDARKGGAGAFHLRKMGFRTVISRGADRRFHATSSPARFGLHFRRRAGLGSRRQEGERLMSFLGRGNRRGRRLAALVAGGTLAAFQTLALIGAPAASAAVVSCSFGSGLLTVNMSGAEEFSATSGNIEVGGDDTFALGCSAIPAVKATLTNTTEIDVNGSSGNDTLTIDLLVNWGTINWKIDLGSGTDTVTLDGSAATLTTGLDTVVGASGIDLNDDGDLDATVAGTELISMLGGDGDDYLCGGGSTITGGPTTIPMSIVGDVSGAGTDEGYDDLCGGLGNDTIDAGYAISGGFGGAAADYLNFTGPITATFTAPLDPAEGTVTGTVTGAGSDNLVDITDIYGSQGNDTITGDENSNDIAGGPGDDAINGGTAGGDEDTADFWDSAEAVTVDLGAGTATGDGNDTLKNMEDVYGSDFNDLIAGAPHVDNYIDGAAGADWIDYSAYSSAVSVTLDGVTPSGDVSEESDTLVHMENALLGSGDDTFKGNAFNNVVNPGGGQNVLDGLTGSDTLDYSSYEEGVTVNLAGGSTAGDSAVNFENVKGTDFRDNITGGPESNTVSSGKGNDNVKGGGGDDTLRLGAGPDVARGGSGDDDMFGKGGNDTLFGGSGTDLGNGGKGKDVCKGVEIKKSCGSAKHPKKAFGGLAAKLA
ncbi:MAG TPA: calcium-binding protein [Actinomycetota bacterium]